MYKKLPIDKILVANRGEIAIRVLRAAKELGLRTVAIYSHEDRFALHRFKADESYKVGVGRTPLAAYLDMDDILRIAQQNGVDAIHPGYGFLAENPEFADKCAKEGIVFIGPRSESMRLLGNKISARNIAVRADVEVIPASGALDVSHKKFLVQKALDIGLPIMLKASWGGGGRGMRMVRTIEEMPGLVRDATAEAQAAFGNGEVYFEKYIERPRHVEVQLIGDKHGNLVHLFDRDCSIQRRNQKIIERAPAPYLTKEKREALCAAALRIGRSVRYENAGTVEFLLDFDTDKFYFIEVNPRIQVEHTVTENITGIDIVKSQILIAFGAEIGAKDCPVPRQKDIRILGHSLQCRITTENPENSFIPNYGRISAYRSATGFGIRLDGGTAYPGAIITPFYDSMLVKVTATALSAEEAIVRMKRALSEFRIRGVNTNILFLEQVLGHRAFLECNYTTKFIDETPDLLNFPKRKDTTSRLLKFVGEVIVNGNVEVKNKILPRCGIERHPQPPALGTFDQIPKGTRDVFLQRGARGFLDWIGKQKTAMITDTTMRDAHQSLLATRFRTYDMQKIAPFYTYALPNLFSIECWGGATFDVCMRFLQECPWKRLQVLREQMPNHMLQMLLRAANGVGYKNYPDNAVSYFIERSADTGIDVFRIFDSFNWIENMKVAMEQVLKTDKICEAAICYTGDIFDKGRPKYDLAYYTDLAKKLKSAGAHIIGIKDMSGILKPLQCTVLVDAIKAETGLPMHLHTHDTSGTASATVVAAVQAGVDIFDGAIDSMAGLTSQPPIGSLVENFRHTPHHIPIDYKVLRQLSEYWRTVRTLYRGFEADNASPTAEVYLHEMPGGQYTNLKEQARSLGIGDDRWHLVADMYAKVNALLGDIIKVTPSSKVVGDMAIMMVTSNLTPEDILNPEKDIAFPESIIAMMRGDLGQTKGGWPPVLQKKILAGERPKTLRFGAMADPIHKKEQKITVEKTLGCEISENELASYIIYPEVFKTYRMAKKTYADVSVLPTYTFFYGMEEGEEIEVEIEKGKTLVVKFLTVGDLDRQGKRQVFFEVNGQPRSISIDDKTASNETTKRPKASRGNLDHVGAMLPGMVSQISVEEGRSVVKGQLLLTLEAMKMQTAINANRDGTIRKFYVQVGDTVEIDDLLLDYA